MKPLIVLLATFLIAIAVLTLATQKVDFHLAARIAMCAMLCFTAIGHFAFTKGMSMMIPEFVPFKTEVIYFTGILEILFGVFLLIPAFSTYAGWVLILFLILLLPANIKAARGNLDYQKGNLDGKGLPYLWFRVPLQLLFIIWTYLSTINL